MGNAERFLDAFNSIETELARRNGADKYVPFSDLLRKTRHFTEGQKTLLRKWAELRNVIVHTPRKGHPEVIADPREDIVVAIERQLEYLVRPPKVLDVLKTAAPTVLAADASVASFLDEVALPKNFSQSPVRMPDGGLSLITTNALARWVAESYEPERNAS